MKRVDKPAPITITVEFTETEAEIICALVGGVRSYSFGSKATDATLALFDILNKTLPDRSTSFSDFFEGDVKVKQ